MLASFEAWQDGEFVITFHVVKIVGDVVLSFGHNISPFVDIIARSGGEWYSAYAIDNMVFLC